MHIAKEIGANPTAVTDIYLSVNQSSHWYYMWLHNQPVLLENILISKSK